MFRVYIVLIIIFLVKLYETHSFKLSLPKSYKVSKILGCIDIEYVDKKTLPWSHPFKSPWSGEKTVVWRSNIIRQKMASLLGLRVPGLNHTFSQVFHIYNDAGCLIYPHGGLIRDFLLGNIQPKDVDIEYSCAPSVIYNVCIKNFGMDRCYINDLYFQMPHNEQNTDLDPLEGVNWRGTIFGPSFGKEYTTNALSYDVNGNNIIIDIVGTGKNDTCDKIINIPVPQNEWNLWLEEQNGYPLNGLKKLPRFWKLRAYPKLYNVHQNVYKFIVDYVKLNWNDPVYPIKNIFHSFYCNMIYKAIPGNGCHIMTELTNDQKKKIEDYNMALKKDLGDDWFNANIVNAGLNRYVIRPPPDICTNDFNLLGFRDDPLAFACVSKMIPPKELQAKPLCPMYGILMGYLGYYWEKNNINHKCPQNMIRLSNTPLEINYPYNKKYEFCIHKLDPKSLINLDGYCYFFPNQGLGYIFRWKPSKFN